MVVLFSLPQACCLLILGSFLLYSFSTHCNVYLILTEAELVFIEIINTFPLLCSLGNDISLLNSDLCSLLSIQKE